MANIIYNKGLAEWLDPATGPGVGDWEVLLERSTSTYTPDKDDETLLNKAGWAEISVATYSRQNLAGFSAAAVHASDLVKVDVADVDFGNLETGQTVKSVIIARNDAGNYVPFMRIDTDSGSLLPRELGGGAFTIQINASGLFTVAQAA
jgi:hypothetical protein